MKNWTIYFGPQQSTFLLTLQINQKCSFPYAGLQLTLVIVNGGGELLSFIIEAYIFKSLMTHVCTRITLVTRMAVHACHLTVMAAQHLRLKQLKHFTKAANAHVFPILSSGANTHPHALQRLNGYLWNVKHILQEAQVHKNNLHDLCL